MTENMLPIAIICGSQRKGSQSAKVARFVQALLVQRGDAVPASIDLGEAPLMLWTDDPGVQEHLTRTWHPISETLRNSEALVIITPEWNGMAPPALKNFFLYCTDHEIADKAALIVGVSSGRGGSVPATELRVSSYKNTHLCYIPEQVIVSHVTEMLNSPPDGPPESEGDAYIRYRLSYGIDILMEYAKALALVRKSNVRNFEQIPYGM
jgi:NAD(P)H-dependent FMN reductase